MKTPCPALSVMALLAAAVAAVFGLAFALWASGSSSATNGCSTTLVWSSAAGDGCIWVYAEDCFEENDWIVVNLGGDNQECKRIDFIEVEDGFLGFCPYLPFALPHDEGEAVVRVDYCPEAEDCDDGIDNDLDGEVDCQDPDCEGDPACEPTPTPTPEPTEMPTPGPTETPTPGAWECGTYGALEPWPDAVVILNPDWGPPGTAFDVELTNIIPNEAAEQPVEVLFGWDAEEQGGELIGTGTVPQHETSTVVQAAVPEDAEPPADVVVACWWHSVDETWYYQSTSFRVGEGEPSETPTPEETPTPGETPEPPPPRPNRIWNCPQAGQWALSMWVGGCGNEIGEALATCGEGAVDAAYYLEPETQQWSHWFRDRPEINDLVAMEEIQALVLLGSATASPPPAEDALVLPVGAMSGCPPPGKWAMAVWLGDQAGGTEGTDTAVALDTCGPRPVDVAYALDSETGTWQRWFRHAAEISAASTGVDINTLNKLVPYQALLMFVPLMTREEAAEAFLPADPLEFHENGHIVFSSDRDGDAEIWRMYGDGTNQVQLTHNDKARDMQPAWSPDGRYIAFVSNQDRIDDKDLDIEDDLSIYVMDNRGSLAKPLTYAKENWDQFNPFWSLDGKEICFDEVVGCGGKLCSAIECLPWPPPEGGWEFTGHTKVCQTNWDINLKEGYLGLCKNIHSADGDWRETWFINRLISPFGRWWAEVLRYECSGGMGIGDDTALCEVIVKTGPDEGWWDLGCGNVNLDPAWSHRGWRLAWASNASVNCDSTTEDLVGDFNIVVNDYSPGTNPDQVVRHSWATTHNANDVYPTWSPDGFEIAFVSNRSGKNQIHKVHEATPYKGNWGGASQLTKEGENYDPDWFGDVVRHLSCSTGP